MSDSASKPTPTKGKASAKKNVETSLPVKKTEHGTVTMVPVSTPTETKGDGGNGGSIVIVMIIASLLTLLIVMWMFGGDDKSSKKKRKH